MNVYMHVYTVYIRLTGTFPSTLALDYSCVFQILDDLNRTNFTQPHPKYAIAIFVGMPSTYGIVCVFF